MQAVHEPPLANRRKKMVSTEKLSSDNKTLRDKQLNVDRQKQQLVARWKKVDGKLICQWIIA